MKLTIGKAGPFDVDLDVDLLLRSRLLIQGSSGSGKSWLLRRLAEQLFGKVPVFIIDPEGEFATLREQYGYVLVGPGGETPADTRSAALVAHKLLELHASAVCDIYEMKPQDRHRWVRLFLEALIDAPKALWQPVVVIVDEAHLFAPEKGAGESEASEAMVSLATRGRKRGFCAVFATQRLGKLRKDAAAELTNVLIGLTSIDIDRDRAVEALGVSKAEKPAVTHALKTLREGQFWGLGRAIAMDRTLIQVGAVQTTHPKLGTSRLEPPPPPAKIRALLPKLADLPQQAEQKAKTEAELRQEIATLRRELAAKPAAPPASVTKVVERFVLKDSHVDRFEKAIEKLGAIQVGHREQLLKVYEPLTAACADILNAIRKTHGAPPAPLRTAPRIHTKIDMRAPMRADDVIVGLPRRTPALSSNGHLTGPERKILTGLAELEALGLHPADKRQLGFMSGYTNVRSGGFSEPLGRLVAGGYLTSSGGLVALTDSGRATVGTVQPPETSQDLQRRISGNLSGPEQRLLKVLLDTYPASLTKEDLAARCDPPYTNIRSGGFSEPLGRLNTLGLIETPRKGEVVASKALFIGADR